MRGRRPKPAAVKKLTGSPGKPANNAEPKYPTGVPECPAHLTGEARREWDRASRLLHDAGVLTPADRGILAGYCTAWSLYVDAVELVNRHGIVTQTATTGMEHVSGPFRALSTALNLLRQFAAELGLSPQTRPRIHATPIRANGDGTARFLKIHGN